MSKMELAFIEEVKYYIENMITDYETRGCDNFEENRRLESLYNITQLEIKEITLKILNNGYLWQKINEEIEYLINEKVNEKLEGEL